MIHLILISAHAAAGLVALVAACFMLRVPRLPGSFGFRTYYFAMVALLGFLILVVGFDWASLLLSQRMVYTGLIVLGGYTLFRADQGRRMLAAGQSNPAGWESRYLDHVGFTVISLFDGFAIVAAIDLAAPPSVVGAVAVSGVVAGILVVNTVKRRSRVAAA